MDVECVFFKRRAGHYFPIPVEYALASLSLSLSAVFLAVEK